MGMMTAGLLLTGYAALAQPTLGWQRRYRVPSATLAGYDLKRVTAHRLAVPGYSLYSGSRLLGTSPYLLFTNNAGDSIGAYTYRSRMLAGRGGQPSGVLSTLASRPDGSFLATGDLTDSLGRLTSFVFTSDSLGNDSNWHYFDPGYGSGGYRLLALPDGYLMLGRIYLLPFAYPAIPPSVMMLVKLDLNGNEVWRFRYTDTNLYINDIVPKLDGSYALVGYRHRSATRTDVWVGAITATGDTLPGRHYAALRGTERIRPYSATLTPGGGLALAGSTQSQTAGTGAQCFVLALDGQGNVRGQGYLSTPNSSPNTGGSSSLLQVQAMTTGDLLAIGPYVPVRNQGGQTHVVAFNGTTLQARWQQVQALDNNNKAAMVLDGNGALTALGGIAVPNPQTVGGRDVALVLLRLTGAGTPFEPPYCQTPPRPSAGYAFNAARDSLRLVDFSTGGPTYAVVSAWHWTFGDGSSYDGPRPPAHRYATPPTAATPVTLTVTNNLGCTATQVLYPFALSTAAQRELAARLSVFPNPATPTAPVMVQWPGLRPGQPALTAELLDAVGRGVRRCRLPVAALAQGTGLDVAGLPAGLYLLRLQAAEGTATRRLQLR